jgi:ribosomal protein S18 acetylase RimI-like enzyme
MGAPALSHHAQRVRLPPTSLRLRPLREDEFDAYVAHGRANYARDLIEHGGAPREIAVTNAEADWAGLLPDGLSSAGQFIFAVEDSETDERIGDLWLAERDTEFEGTVAFVYSIEIFERFLGRGFGRQAMLLLEDEARSRGLARISLNVFGRNKVARSLYRSLGYAENAVWMGKEIMLGDARP